jgi:tripartite-type tricarboxylate transporter receptor subunit TctC
MPRIARAQVWPNRVVRLVVGFPPGGGNDAAARIVAGRLSEIWGQQVVVENKGGAGGKIAMETVAHAPPDGYTIVIADPAGSLAASVSLYPKPNFDPVKDLSPIALLGTSGAVLSVSNTLPAKTLSEFVALAKGRPGELMFGSAGNGTPGHLNGELFKRLTGIDVIHVPYRVGSQAVTDLIAGRISFWISPIATVLPQIQAGQLRPLAVSGRTRARELPDVPTVRESGFGDYDVSTSYALFAPAGTPQPILGRLQAEVKRALETESVNSRLRIAGVEPGIGPPEEVRRLLTTRIAQWSDVIKMSGIRIDER